MANLTNLTQTRASDINFSRKMLKRVGERRQPCWPNCCSVPFSCAAIIWTILKALSYRCSMARTRYYISAWWPIRLHAIPCQMLYSFWNLWGHSTILLTLKELFTHDSEVVDLFFGAYLGSEPSLLFSNSLFSLGSEPVQGDSQHDFTWMTDEANGSVVLAEL